ncbi:hypothetical protein [Nocardia salmonicida]|uniref:hypothetical protein n=1 Tax=Nocardia salmonicida TaxID=53431 RepID=UPI0007A455C7|nr:hypothetical protein [Nocardia salmonicida]MBC7299493.1 hypothetical protein [Nocardia sp.]
MGQHPGQNNDQDYFDKHFIHVFGMSPGQANSSPIWNNYIRPFVDPFLDDRDLGRYSHEEELHELVQQAWADAGVDNDLTLHHEYQLSEGTSQAQGSRIDYLAVFDDQHTVGIEVKAEGSWHYAEKIHEQLERYAETGAVNTMLLLTTDPELTEIDWPRHLEVPLFIVELAGRRGRL